MSSGTDGAGGGAEPENKALREPSEPLDAPQNERCNAVCNTDSDLRAQIAAAVLAGDDAEAARLMAHLSKPKLRVVR